ncbi:MAG: glucose-6-phosphate isomerase, partial [Phycisphaerae bacterium]
DALGTTDDAMIVRFLDNTDPDGIDRTLAELDDALERTLTLVISKSGGTKETRNAMVEVQHAYRNAGLQFAPHAVAVTCEGSALCEKARSEKWLAVVPIWDWVGGRTSVTSAVGLLPAALQGLDVDALLNGAAACDAVTRGRDIAKNPAALMALMWYYAGEGRGQRHMVVIPYRDRLALLGAYLQQLVMESVGKEKNREGHVVHQGLTVYGNKGSTDQHAYVQQLRDGRNDFFVTFLNVVADRDGPSVQVEEGVTTGDYLHAFWLGTRAALHDNGRESMTLTLNRLDARAMGVLIALFERAVGLYAELIDVNAYNQPGVEAGKKAATAVLQLQRKILAHLGEHPGSSFTVDEIAAAIGETDAVETVHHVLQHLAARHDRPVTAAPDADASRTRYTVE